MAEGSYMLFNMLSVAQGLWRDSRVPGISFRVMENASCSPGYTLRTFCSLALPVSRHGPGL